MKTTKSFTPTGLVFYWLAFNFLVFAVLAWLLPASAAASGNPAVMLFSMPRAWQAVAWLTAGTLAISGLGLLLARSRAWRADRTAVGQGGQAHAQSEGRSSDAAPRRDTSAGP